MGLNCHDLSDMEIEAPMWGFGNVNIIKPVKALKGAVKSFLLHFFDFGTKAKYV